ncbi:hypothetical protein GCM10028805_65990 [Spirosoma harenae]
MKNTIYPNANKAAIPYSYEASLNNWLEETATFYLYYKQLAPYVNQALVPQKIRLINRHLHCQCTVSQLRKFLSKMRTALKHLLHDMDVVDSDHVPVTSQFCRKLIAHTRMLHRLNEEARKMNLVAAMTEN